MNSCYYTLYTIYCIVYYLYCTVYNIQCTMCTIYYILYVVQTCTELNLDMALLYMLHNVSCVCIKYLIYWIWWIYTSTTLNMIYIYISYYMQYTRLTIITVPFTAHRTVYGVHYINTDIMFNKQSQSQISYLLVYCRPTVTPRIYILLPRQSLYIRYLST